MKMIAMPTNSHIKACTSVSDPYPEFSRLQRTATNQQESRIQSANCAHQLCHRIMDRKTRNPKRESKIWYHRPEMVAPCFWSKEMFPCATVEMREVRHQQTEYGYPPCELSLIAPIIIATRSIYVSLRSPRPGYLPAT